MAILYIMCGPSGCGKSTWAKQHNEIHCISRDEIRFQMLQAGEDYFSHEEAVFRRFSGLLARELMNGNDVIADATHLNRNSRKKLTRAIDCAIQDYEIIYVVFKADVNTCLAHNNNRAGLAHVPENVIEDMCKTFRKPTIYEDERAKEVIEV